MHHTDLVRQAWIARDLGIAEGHETLDHLRFAH